MTHELTIHYGDDLLASVGQSASRFEDEAKLLLAAKLYELGRVSSGQAASLCGLSRAGFLFAISRLGVPASNLAAEDMNEDLSFASHG
jgi:predicted HTH domain antitoxin